MTNSLRTFLAATALSLALGGCGVKGSLDTPRTEASATAEAQSGQGKAEGETGKPHRGFVLDGLLR